MKKEFKIYKEGMTSEIVIICSKEGEPFDFDAKVAKYKWLGYTVWNMNDELI